MFGQRTARWIKKLQKYSDRAWYLPLLSIIIGLDLFVLIIPSDAMMISSVLLRPKRWGRICLWVSAGSAFGALALAALLQWDSAWLMHFLPDIFQSSGWEQTDAFLDTHGGWALAVFSFSLLPQQPAVALAALAGMPLSLIFISVFAGRLVKYGLLAYFASHAPRLLGKVWFIRKELAQFDQTEA